MAELALFDGLAERGKHILCGLVGIQAGMKARGPDRERVTRCHRDPGDAELLPDQFFYRESDLELLRGDAERHFSAEDEAFFRERAGALRGRLDDAGVAA